MAKAFDIGGGDRINTSTPPQSSLAFSFLPCFSGISLEKPLPSVNVECCVQGKGKQDYVAGSAKLMHLRMTMVLAVELSIGEAHLSVRRHRMK